MDTRTILADLKAELTRLNQAIAALESLDGTPLCRERLLPLLKPPRRRQRNAALPPLAGEDYRR